MIETLQIADVLEECLSLEKDFLNLLRKLVTIETPQGKPESHKKLFAILEKELQTLDYNTRILPGNKSGGQLYARPINNKESSYQLLLGHCDTVWPKGTLEKMPYKREKNILTGPGIYDMKAGVTMMIMALRVMKEKGLEPQVDPVIFINSDEETGSRESVFRIKNLARAMNRVYVLEPSLDPDGKLKTRRKGVGHYEARIKGVSSHAGIEPEKGRSAIVELSYLIQKLYAFNNPERGISVNVGVIDGGIGTNVVAPESSASVDVRVLTKKDAEQIDRKIKSIEASTPDVEIEIKGGFNRPPLVQNKRNRALWNAARQIGDELGLEFNEGTSGGGSDGSYTSVYTATLDGLGAVGDGAHSPTEKVFLKETLERIALLVNLLMLPPCDENSDRVKK